MIQQAESALVFQYVQDMIQQAEATLSEEDPPTSVDSLIPKVPGVCYIRLLKDLNPQVIQGRLTRLV